MTNEEREELYQIQVSLNDNDKHFKGIAFVPRDWRCSCCHTDLLEDERVVRDARAGLMITGCSRCARSFVD